MGPMLYSTAFRDIAHSSILTLLFAAVAVHYVLQGLMLPLFGAEGFRLEPFDAGPHRYRHDAAVAAAHSGGGVFAALVAAFWLFFRFAILGKILRATSVNRIGARLVGISPDMSGAVAFGLASLIGAISGILIAPLTTVYYDSGFLLALKGFVGAVVGGLASFPLAAPARSWSACWNRFSSFYASALKESLVFAALIPILLYMSIDAAFRPRRRGARGMRPFTALRARPAAGRRGCLIRRAELLADAADLYRHQRPGLRRPVRDDRLMPASPRSGRPPLSASAPIPPRC